jgi:hypothetical protein
MLKSCLIAAVTLLLSACATTPKYDADGDGFAARGGPIPEISLDLKVPNDQPTWKAKVQGYNRALETATKRWGLDLEFSTKKWPLSKAETNCFKARCALIMHQGIYFAATLGGNVNNIAACESNVNFFSEMARNWCGGGGPNGTTNRGLLMFNEAQQAFGWDPNSALSRVSIGESVEMWTKTLGATGKYMLGTNYYYLSSTQGFSKLTGEAKEGNDNAAKAAMISAFFVWLSSGGFVFP